MIAADLPADQKRLERSAAGLNLREFRHGFILALIAPLRGVTASSCDQAGHTE